MVATIQGLRPPRAVRWVERWRLVSLSSFLLALLAGYFLWPWGLILSAGFIALGIWSGGVAIHRGRIVGEGSEGEAMTARVLDALPMDARVLHSVQFHSGERTREIDHLLITHSALFVIETKYLRGRVSGGVEDREWTLHKRARKTRSRYKRGFYNPLKQVATQIYHVRKILEEKLPRRWSQECNHIWIQGVVVFAHPQCDASDVKNLGNGVVTLDDLPNYLRNYRAPSRASRLSYGLRREISRVLTGKD